MTPNHLVFLALDINAQRMRDAEVHNRFVAYEDAEALESATPGLARRSLARVAASVSRGSAALARRLDERAVETDAFPGSSLLA